MEQIQHDDVKQIYTLHYALLDAMGSYCSAEHVIY
jgi:hypothetical protein